MLSLKCTDVQQVWCNSYKAIERLVAEFTTV
jgi:hypothetical protein